MTSTPDTHYLTGNWPITNITPFTYREGATNLQILLAFQRWAEAFGPEVQEILNAMFAKWREEFERLEEKVDQKFLNWQTLFDEFMADVVAQLEALNDQAVANLIANIESKTRIELEKHLTYENVLAHGVKGLGISDETAALQAMVDKFPDGTTFYFPPGKYRVDGNVHLRSDDLRFTGTPASIIKKMSTSTNYCVFVGLAGIKTGYSSGVTNLEIDNLRFEGDLAQGASISAFSGNRAGNVRVHDNVFSQCSQNGHVLDLMGCENVYVYQNRFGGIKPVAGREYTEAIQVDSSVRGGAGFPVPEGEFFDGLGCRNVNVFDNDFTDETINGVNYKAQIPFGSHAWVDGKPHHKLSFKQNRVVNVIDASTSAFPGITHFFGCRDIDIWDNTVIGGSSAFVRFVGGANAHRPEDADLPVAPLSPATYPQQGESVRIRRNRIEGVTLAGQPIIWGYGTATLPLKDMEVTSNTFTRCATVAESYMVQFTRTDSLIYSGNRFIGCNGSPLFVQYLDRLDFDDNKSDGGGYFPANITNVEKVRSSNNKFSNYANQLNFVECSEVSLTGNEVVVNTPIAAIRLTTSPGRNRFVKIIGNDVRYIGTGPHDLSPGIYVDEDYLSGVVVGNVSRNYTQSTFAPVPVQSVANVVSV